MPIKLLFLLGLIGIVTGIKVGPVKLIHERPYLTYQLGTSWNLTVLECPVILEKNEVLGEVEWKFSDGNVERGNFFWKKGAGGTATGLLKDAVKLNRVDGNLEFTTLRYDLAGYYSCVATLENDIYGGNPDWELLIVDTTANSRYESLSPTGERCKFISTFRISPTFPEPTVHSGLYSKKHGSFADEVEPIEWIKQVYSNKSVAYSSEEVEFEITSSIPVDVVFMNTVGVTKADGTYIALTATEVSDPRFNARGCPEYKLKAYQQIEYNSPDKTCRDEIRIPTIGDLRATVTCQEGYVSAGNQESLELVCNTNTWEWNMEQEHSFMCVVDPYGGSGVTVTSSSLLLIVCMTASRLLQQ